MILETKEYLNYSDVLIKPKYSLVESRQDVNIEAYLPYGQAVPILITNMDSIATLSMAFSAQEEGFGVCLSKYIPAQKIIEAHSAGLKTIHFLSMGMSEADVIKVAEIINKTGADFPILVDVANGYSRKFLEYLEQVRKAFPNSIIMAGNVATPDILHHYNNVGIDIVRIGIGPGGQCRTREVAGIGVPQFTAVMECASAADQLNMSICADGGINELADFAKALGAGAKLVCAGSFFAGHTECEGDVVEKNGKAYKRFYGMSSDEAMIAHGGLKEYRTSEGRVSLVPYKGHLSGTLKEIKGALRSTMAYTDTYYIGHLSQNTTFIKVKETMNRKYEESTIGK